MIFQEYIAPFYSLNVMAVILIITIGTTIVSFPPSGLPTRASGLVTSSDITMSNTENSQSTATITAREDMLTTISTTPAATTATSQSMLQPSIINSTGTFSVSYTIIPSTESPQMVSATTSDVITTSTPTTSTFALITTDKTTTLPSAVSGAGTGNDGSSSSGGAGVIAGVVIGVLICIIMILLIIFGVLWYYKRGRKRMNNLSQGRY